MTVDDMKSLGDDSMRMDVTHDEKSEYNRNSIAPSHNSHLSNELIITPQHHTKEYSAAPDNVDIARHPVTAGFLVSFLVDARGGAMRGCRHSGVRVIVPPRCAASPTRITCRYVRPQRTPHPPPLMEGEALASRLLELGPVGAKFLGPVIIEVPHFASLRGKQREIIVLRSDNGETWKEHTLEANEEAIQDVLNHSFDGEELSQLEDLHTNRITRILTNDFPHYFAVVTRMRQEVHAIGPDGGTVSSTAVPLVQAVFPPNALTKKIRVGLQAQAIEPELVSKLLGHGVAVSPIVTVEPRRRKFHKAIMLSMPAPKAHSQGMINQYQGASSTTLRLLCSITGGQSKAVWEDVTGSTPLTFVKECVSFTTTVSARFWLIDCRNVSDAAKMATELYHQAAHVPFMAKFVVFAKRVSQLEARVRVFCMTDDKEDKTLEHQEHFIEIAKSRDIEVLEGKEIWMEFAGNLVPVLQSNDQPKLGFKAFKENRCAFNMRLRDHDEEPVGRIIFMADSKAGRLGWVQSQPLCTLNLVLPSDLQPDSNSQSDLLSINKDYSYLHHGGISKPDSIHRADFRLSDICNLLDEDWEKLALELDIPPSDVDLIKEEYDSPPHQAMVMFRLWLRQQANKANGNQLEKALNKIGRQDIVDKCICNVELVTDDMEKALAKVHLDQSGFDNLKEELGPSRDTSLTRHAHLDKSYLGSEEKLDDKSDRSSYDPNDNKNSTGNDLTETLNDNASTQKEITEEVLDNKPKLNGNANEEVLEEITQQLNTLQATPKITIETFGATPPPSPEVNHEEETDLFNKNHDVQEIHNDQGIPEPAVEEQLFQTSTPVKHQFREPEVDPIEVLKKHVGDTLTFLHQERNDYLPEDEIIIPIRKDDHVAKEIDLEQIPIKTPKKNVEFTFEEYIGDKTDEVPFQNGTKIMEEIEFEDIAKLSPEILDQTFENPLKGPKEIVKEIPPTLDLVAEEVLKKVNQEFEQPKGLENDICRLENNINYTVNEQEDESVRTTAEEEVENVIKQAEEVVNEKLHNDIDISTVDDLKTIAEDSLDNLESLKDDSISVIQEKSDEAFRFLENEASSPLPATKSQLDDSFYKLDLSKQNFKTTFAFLEQEVEHANRDHKEPKVDEVEEESISEDSKSPKSSIPVAKVRKSKSKKKKNKNGKEKEKDLQLDTDQLAEQLSKSPTEEDLLSRIPVVKGTKVKTIKKHSKDPLKEFVNISKDVNWDDDDDSTVTTKIIKTVITQQTDPIVKTTVTRITTEGSKIPVLGKDGAIQKDNELDEDDGAIHLEDDRDNESTPNKSKIPVLKTETVVINSPEVVEGSTRTVKTITTTTTKTVEPSTKSTTLDSDSEEEEHQQHRKPSSKPPLKGILKKSTDKQTPQKIAEDSGRTADDLMRTVGSSSGSDIALHEEGAELSSDSACLDSIEAVSIEDFYHQEPQYHETTIEEIDPITGAKITKTVRQLVSHSAVSPVCSDSDLMQTVLDQFMSEERNPR